MKSIFLVFGYGVPKNILKDENYSLYLKTVFNKIYDSVVKNNAVKPLIIYCGGETDMFRPYKRTEADEMIKFFRSLLKQRPFLKKITNNWLFVSENKSLSTLENILNSKKIIFGRKIKKGNIFIFGEQTREKRLNVLSKKIFSKNFRVQVVPVDFDVSKNRYLPNGFLEKKEKLELEHSLWALKSAANLKKHHQLFEEKMAYLRKAGPKVHTDAMRRWWIQKLKEVKNEHRFP